MFSPRALRIHRLLSPLAVACINIGMLASATPPWWGTGSQPVIVPNTPQNNHGVANIGQAKWMAKNALDALRGVLPQTADSIEADLVGPGMPFASWDPPITAQQKLQQRAPLLIGQLKAIVAPFYQHLHDVAPQWLNEESTRNLITLSPEGLPWTQTTTDDANRSVALIGQLKAMFTLDFNADYETAEHQDGISDLWEHAVVNAHPIDDWTNIGTINTSNSYQAGNQTGIGSGPGQPVDPDIDSDGDGLKDSEDADKDDEAVCWKKTPECSYAVIELPTPPNDAQLVDLGEGGHVIANQDTSGDWWNQWEWPMWAEGVPGEEYFNTFVWNPESNTWSEPLELPEDIRGVGVGIDANGNVHGEGLTGLGEGMNWPGARRITFRWFKQGNGWSEASSDMGTGAFSNEAGAAAMFPSFARVLALFGDDQSITEELYSYYDEGDMQRVWEIVRQGANSQSRNVYSESSQGYDSSSGGSGIGEPKGWHAFSYYTADDLTGEGFYNHIFGHYKNGQLETLGAPNTTDLATDLACLDADLTIPEKSTVVIWAGYQETFVGYRNANSGALNWVVSQKPAEQRIAGIVNSRGEGLSGQTIWRNGRWINLNSLVDSETWSNVGGIDINDKGMILAKADKTGAGEAMSVLLMPVAVKQRIPKIAEDRQTTYKYEAVSEVPWGQPVPGVEITQKNISGSQVNLSADIYDALSDVAENEVALTPKMWVNSREVTPVAGDKNGVFHLEEYAYRLFPGRNEITVCVQNALGGQAHHTVVVEGDEEQGYEIVEEPVKVPAHPTYPVVYELGGLKFQEDQKIILKLAGKSVDVSREEDDAVVDDKLFRSKPFVSVDVPPSATAEVIAAIPEDKPIFLAELSEDLVGKIVLSPQESPITWTSYQSGLELISPKAVEITQTSNHKPALQVRVRGLGKSPVIAASLVTYKSDEAVKDVTAAFSSKYHAAYEAEDDKSAPITLSINAVDLKEGYNLLKFDFAKSRSLSHSGSYHSFRFSAPAKAGVRVFSANRKKDIVQDGVTSRPQDIWYPVDADADLSALADALKSSTCEVVGMTDVNTCFDDAPLKRSFLVRGPPGSSFQAFDKLYAAQGRAQRSQTFSTNGTNGAALAGELDRVQTDVALPASARNALGIEIAKTYQLHNGFEDFVPQTHQAYVDPGNGIQQPNSWTMRGSSLPDHAESNPSPWTVTSTLSNSARAASDAGIIKIDTTGENTAYYATTSATAPWNLTGARAVALRFKLLDHDSINGANGALQLAVGDGTRTWICQVAPTQIKVQGTAIPLQTAKFPGGLIDGKFHTLQFNFSGSGNNSLVSIDGEVLTATAAAQPGPLNGIAFGDPGSGISGKFETESLGFENSDLKYQYGIQGSDDYANSDEISCANNVLLYLRSKGLPFRTSPVARWVRVLDPDVYEWLFSKYTGQSNQGFEKELHILTDTDVWLGSTVDVDESEEYASKWPWAKKTKVTHTLVLDKEETQIWSSDQTRNDMQLAGILMAWCYEQAEYKSWLAQKEGNLAEALRIERKHLVDNIAKCAKRVETTINVGGEIAISMTNEYVDYAITLNSVRQGDYMAMIGFLPLVPGSTAKAFRLMNKEDGALIEAVHQLSTKLDDFPGGKHEFPNNNLPGDKRILDFEKIFANAEDAEAVTKARHLTSGEPIPNSQWPGIKLLDTFANSNVTVFKTKEPIKAYRCFSSNPNISEYGPSGGFLMFEKPVHRTQVEMDQALGSKTEGFFVKNTDGTSAYDRYVEVEIPEGVYVYMGYAADQGAQFKGGGTQFWVDNVTRDAINWEVPHHELPQY